MDYINMPLRSKAQKRCPGVTAAVCERKLFRLVAVSFGLLCILQAALNVSLRLAFYSSDRGTPDVETSSTNTTERNQINFDHYFKQGWVYFSHSLYYISPVKKSWQESREDCLNRGADLVIINSKEEQDLTRKFKGFLWIGLTQKQGTWTWVDGTPLNKSYWNPGEPNNRGGKEGCVQIRRLDDDATHLLHSYSWNDIACGDQYFWICEKIVA